MFFFRNSMFVLTIYSTVQFYRCEISDIQQGPPRSTGGQGSQPVHSLTLRSKRQ